jgi:lysophospholipase L1-like esterase
MNRFYHTTSATTRHFAWLWLVILLGTQAGPCVLAMAQAAGSNTLTVYNKGIGGQNSEQGRARFAKDVLDLKPTHVFIYFGLNDTLNEPRFVELDRFLENLAWMVKQARAAGINPVLCTIHHASEEPLLKRHKRESYGEEGPNGKINRYNAAIRTLAMNQKVLLADFAAVADSNRNERISADGVHLTPSGYRALAKCFFDTIENTLKSKDIIVCLGDSVTFGAGVNGAGSIDGDTYPSFLRQIKLK